MAKRDKNKLFYEVTKERPLGSFHVLMVGGSAGSVLAFLVVSLVGAYEGVGIDSLVFAFLVASILGFLFGALLSWFAWRYFDEWVPVSALWGGTPEKPIPAEMAGAPAPPAVEAEPNPVVEDEEAKGKSVDFVFPELSPDKQ